MEFSFFGKDLEDKEAVRRLVLGFRDPKPWGWRMTPSSPMMELGEAYTYPNMGVSRNQGAHALPPLLYAATDLNIEPPKSGPKFVEIFQSCEYPAQYS